MLVKGLSGATISIKLSDESNLISNENTIIGNTVLYGATSGKFLPLVKQVIDLQ